MRLLFVLIVLHFSLLTWAQSVPDYVENGRLKQKKRDFRGAIKEYEKAIQIDSANKIAFYNKAISESFIKDYSSALNDLNQSLKIDSNFADAIFRRASILFEKGKYDLSIGDLNKFISLRPKHSKALILRGKSYIKIENKDKACTDFIKAKRLGDTTANKYVQQYFCESKVQQGESLVLDWPIAENWKITYQSSKDNKNVYLLARANETSKNWTESAGMMSVMGVTGVDLPKEMMNMFVNTQGGSTKANFTFIDKDLDANYPWIMFIIETINNKECQCYESQFWYILQGKQAVYSCFRSVRGSTFTAAQKDKFKKFFKTSKILNK
jgi:tetratricopeptide (TPR) repeat protein